MIVRRLRSVGGSLRFLAANLKAFSKLPCFDEQQLAKGMFIRGCRSDEAGQAAALRSNLDGHRMTWSLRALLTLVPAKCCLVLCDPDGNLQGLTIFYFNKRDLVEGTIHEGFIGVRRELAGNGFATALRQAAKAHWGQAAGVKGISSRITLANMASVASGKKAGYECVETYEDEVSGERRGYFINRLDREEGK